MKLNQGLHFPQTSSDVLQTESHGGINDDPRPPRLVTGGWTRRHFQESRSSTEGFRPVIRPIRVDNSAEQTFKPTKKILLSKNKDYSEEFKAVEKRHVLPSAESPEVKYPSSTWKTKRVVLDEFGQSRRVLRSGELDFSVSMTRKHRVSLESSETRPPAECSAGLFKGGGLIPGSTIRIRQNSKPRDMEIMALANAKVIEKLRRDLESTRERENRIASADVEELSVRTLSVVMLLF